METSIEVRFKVYGKLRHGEDIRLIGNTPSLGCDDINRAIPMVTTSNDFPWWWNKEAIFISQNYQNVFYRYAIFSGGKFVRYEGNNDFRRSLSIEKVDIPIHTTSDILDHSRGTTLLKENTAAISSIEFSSEYRKRVFCSSSQSCESSLSSLEGVIVVTYFLPVIVAKDMNGNWTIKWNEENLLAKSYSHSCPTRVCWVGGIPPKYSLSELDQNTLSAQLREMSCYPIFLNRDLHSQFYKIFCNQHICPLLHHYYDPYGLIEKTMSIQHTKRLWFGCTSINQLFSRKIIEIYQKGYLIWIHGYHLMLLPSYVRRKIPEAKIGIYLYTPFPSSEIWKTLWCREDLLLGMLCADQIGFLLFEYARHFLTSCRRLLGLHYDFSPTGSTIIRAVGRDVFIICIHVGANNILIEKSLNQTDFLQQSSRLFGKFRGKTVVTSIAKLERRKGIQLTLLGIKLFLQSYPKYVNQLSFIIIGISASGDEYHQTRQQVTCLVRQLNSEFPDVIFYEERKETEINCFDRVCLYAVSDILIVGGTRDGLNIFPMEYTYLKWKLLSTGIVIISEFVSAARSLRGSLLVNPWRREDMKNSLHYGLSMSLQEKTSRFECNLEFCREMTICKWIETVLSDLMKIQHSIDPTTITTLGLGPNYRVTNLRSAFSTLDLSILTKAYRKSKQRLIILNWGGTLIDPIENFEAYGLATGIENSLKEMSPQLKDVLATLAHDLQNHIFVISRQDTKTMASYFGDIKGLGLAAEHGCYYLHPKAHLLHPDKWQAMISIDDRTWMDAVKRIMKLYTHRTHGSYIEEKESALIWQYDDADLEFGLLQSQELEEHLSDILSIHPLEITRGPGYLEIRPSGLSKGYFLQHMLSKLNSCGQIDFLLTMGNDITDEEMFDITNLTQATMGAPHCFSIAVGKQISTAKYCVNTPEEAREVLYTLLRASKLRRDYSSVLDFPTHYSFSKVGPEIVPRKSSGKRRSYSEVDVALLSSEATPKTSPNLDMKQDLHLISTAHDMPLAFTDKEDDDLEDSEESAIFI